MPPPATIAKSVRDALIPLGAELNETPMTPHRIRHAVREAQNASQVQQEELA